MIIKIDIKRKEKLRKRENEKTESKNYAKKESPKYIFGEEVKTPTVFDGIKNTLYRLSIPLFVIIEILLIVLILMDVFFNNSINWPTFMHDAKSILILLFAFILVLIFIMTGVRYSNKQKNALIGNQLLEINKLDAEVSSLRMNLLNSSPLGGLLNLDIEEMIFHKILKDLVKGNRHLNSAQVYTYSIYMNEESVNIRCNYIEGYVQEDNEINATLQSYYKIENDVAKSLQYIIKEASSLRETNNKNQYNDKKTTFLSECYSLLDKLIGACEDASKVIKEGDTDYLEKKPCIKSYPEFIRMILYFLSDDDGQAFEIEKGQGFDEILTYLGDKRLGLLGSILTSGIYALREDARKKDKPRTYGFYRFRFRNRNYILQMEMSKVFYTTFLDANNEFEKMKDAFMNNLSFYDNSMISRR